MSFAVLSNNIVIQIVEEFPTTPVEIAIDITDIVPIPKIGWKLEGNKLVSNKSSLSVEELKNIQQKEQQEFGAKLCLDLVNKMGGRNLLLSSQGVSVNVSSLLSTLGTAKALLETGGLKTARGFIGAVSGNFPYHSDILVYATNEITKFLGENGYE